MIDFPLLKPNDAATYLGMTETDFRNARRSTNPPPAYRLGKSKWARLRYSREQLDNWAVPPSDTYGLRPPEHGTTELDLDQISHHDTVQKLLRGLSPRERKVIELRYGFDGEPATLDEIGQQLDCTRERASQIIWQALKKMQTLAGDRSYTPPPDHYSAPTPQAICFCGAHNDNNHTGPGIHVFRDRAKYEAWALDRLAARQALPPSEPPATTPNTATEGTQANQT